MTVKEYQEIVKKTAIYPESEGLTYTVLGLTGEAGEVAEKVKKLIRDKRWVFSSLKYLKSDSYQAHDDVLKERDAIAKELGDVVWYVAAIAEELGLTLEDVMRVNYEKLIARKVQNKLSGSGDNREVDTGAAPSWDPNTAPRGYFPNEQ